MALLKAVLWDMDGTLIDSEPIWHQGEMEISREYGGDWSPELGWQCTGKPVPFVAQRMVEHGTRLSADEITPMLIQYVFEAEKRQMPWVPGVLPVLSALADAGIPSVLVTASPRGMADNLLSQAPQGTFVGSVSGSDGLPKKPDPASYVAAARLVGVDAESDPRAMARCVAIEDSVPGLQSASASGATTLAQTAFNPSDTSAGPRFETVDGYDGVTVESLESCVERRLGIL